MRQLLLLIWRIMNTLCGFLRATGFRAQQGSLYAPGSADYTTPGTHSWMCPNDVTSVTVTCVGGGGNGGNQYGGGAGGTGVKTITVTPGVFYTVVVGSAEQDSYFNTLGTVAGGAASGQTGGSYTGTSGSNGSNGGGSSSSGGGYSPDIYQGGAGASSTAGTGGSSSASYVYYTYKPDGSNKKVYDSNTDGGGGNATGYGSGGGGGWVQTNYTDYYDAIAVLSPPPDWIYTSHAVSINAPAGSGSGGKVSLSW